ncbi:MAG: hypothetical protein AAF235_11400, partial [Planctomycetota bacterium]
LFSEMLDTVRDRVTDYIFKARISPQAAMQQMQREGRLGQSQRAGGGIPGGAGGQAGGPGRGRSRQQPASGAAQPGSEAMLGGGSPAGLGGIIGPGFAPPAAGPGSAPGSAPLPASSNAGPAEGQGSEDRADDAGAEAPTANEQVEAARAAKAADRGKERTR